MNYFLVVRLVSAHVVGDFLLQSRGFCEGKKKLETWKGWYYQSVHAFIQALMTYLFVGEWSCILLPAVVFVSHFVIDVIKSFSCRDTLSVFAIDQFSHLAVLGVIYYFILDGDLSLAAVSWQHAWTILLAYVLVLQPASILIEIFNRRFDGSQDGKSLIEGGKNIGYLERILIVTFVLSGWMEGIGFLLAAKSVFRFGDLKNNKELKHTEYVLVGTLLSFTIAVLIGLMTRLIIVGV